MQGERKGEEREGTERSGEEREGTERSGEERVESGNPTREGGVAETSRGAINLAQRSSASSSVSEARRKSRFISAMDATLMAFGHTASHS